MATHAKKRRQPRDIGGKFLRKEKTSFLVVTGHKPDQNIRHDAPGENSLKNELK
jgi:hypothetical protein